MAKNDSSKKVKTARSKTTSFAKSKIFLIFVIALAIAATVGLQACSKNSGGNNDVAYLSNINAYSSKTAVGYAAEYLGTVDRQTPEVSDGGLVASGDISAYPRWGKNLSVSSAGKNKLINESSWTLPTINTTIGSDGKPTNTYNKMDAEGNLYLNNDKVYEGQLSGKGKMQVPTKLYKHTAAASMYGGAVSDSEPALIKRITLRDRKYSSYSLTGLYAPAGEIIKVQMSGAEMNASNGITIHIGQALYNGKANNIWSARGINRMPTVLNTWVMNKTTSTYDAETDTWTCYVGSFLGGPIYVRNTSATINVTFTGGVAYSHFILGYTTQEEWEQNNKSSVPYFDLEVWQYGVLHSGPKSYAKRFSYDDLYKAASLWEKISLVDKHIYNQGIVFLYDCFVAAGAAVAFPGQMSVNCPASWLTSSLNYSSFVTGGSWGNMHEYHHNFQNYGIGGGADGEVTNNGLNLVSYSLFTKISSARGIGNYGASGTSGWNTYTSATWALNRVNSGSITSTNGLAVYATLLHNFGQDAYIKSTGRKDAAYFARWQQNTHQNFSYYAELVNAYTPGANPIINKNNDNANYPMFVPISCVYQTGRTYMYDNEKREITTMQPYIIAARNDFKVDLNPYTVNSAGQYVGGSIVIGNLKSKDPVFKYKIKKVDDSKADGSLVKTSEEGVYTFKPGKSLYSGKIYVTLEITTTSGAKTYNGSRLDDVDLILEIEQSQESTKMTLERTTYDYTTDGGYTDAEAAYKANFKGYTSVNEKYNHSNATQNANTDIWYTGTVTSAGTANTANLKGKKEHQIISPTDNKVEVIDGKLYFSEDGKYRIYLRGRVNCAMYYSLDGKKYTVGATIKDAGFTESSFNTPFRLNDPNTYFDIQFTTQSDGRTRTVTVFNDASDKTGKVLSDSHTGDRWLYIKEVLISKTILNEKGGIILTPYIGIGSAQWIEPQYTMEVLYYDSNGTLLTDSSGNPITDSEDSRIDTDRTVTKYYLNGVEVSEEQANDTSLIEPTAANYANMYRCDYELKKQFSSEYFYTPQNYDLPFYKYSFSKSASVSNSKATIVSSNYAGDSGYAIENAIDGNTGSGSNFHATLDPTKPLELVVDLGEVVYASSMTIKGLNNPNNTNKNNNRGIPSTFKLLVSSDGVKFEEVLSREAFEPTALDNSFGFKIKNFRYYKLIVSDSASTSNPKKIAFNEIQFSYQMSLSSQPNNMISLDNSMFGYKGNWKIKSVASNFGHVYVGEKGSEIKFEFTGKYLGVISSNKFGKDFEVYIDGKKVDSVWLNEPSGHFSISYISQELSSGKHNVIIKCLGEASFDSILKFE